MSPSFNASSYGSGKYSPLTLDLQSSKIGRLLFLVGCSSIGSLINGYFVATFFVEPSLRTVGNVFLACVGLSDLLVTAIIIPTSAVVLLSGEWDIESLCYILQFVAESATYSYNLFFMLVAAENYLRLCCKAEAYAIFKAKNVTNLAILVFAVCFATAGVGVYFDLDYNYCTRAHFGNSYFRVATAIFFQCVPFVVTIISLTTSTVYVRRRARKQSSYRRSHQFSRDNSSTIMNLFAYIFFVITWTPYLIVVYAFPDSNDTNFYHGAWVGLTRSVLTSLMYPCTNRNFNRAYGHLFNYCCCKNSLSTSWSSRRRRQFAYRPKRIIHTNDHDLHHTIDLKQSSLPVTQQL